VSYTWMPAVEQSSVGLTNENGIITLCNTLLPADSLILGIASVMALIFG
jgi:hypothetical protein